MLGLEWKITSTNNVFQFLLISTPNDKWENNVIVSISFKDKNPSLVIKTREEFNNFYAGLNFSLPLLTKVLYSSSISFYIMK